MRWRINSAPGFIPSPGKPSAICCRGQNCWSIPPRSACTASPRWISTSACCRPMPWSPIWSMCRWQRRCWRRHGPIGLKTADGLGMLLHQAVRGFELWFGQRPGSDIRSFARWSRPISQRFERRNTVQPAVSTVKAKPPEKHCMSIHRSTFTRPLVAVAMVIASSLVRHRPTAADAVAGSRRHRRRRRRHVSRSSRAAARTSSCT